MEAMELLATTDKLAPAGVWSPPGQRVARAGRASAPLTLLFDVLLARCRDLSLHGEMVAHYCGLTAGALGMPAATIERVRLAGALHDLGKVVVPRETLNKPGRLTTEEWAEIKRHPQVGADLLAEAQLHDIASWVAAHHERPDGLGYPLGLAEEAIPLEAKVLAVADAYDAMRAERAYKTALSHERASTELCLGAGTQFDVRVVHAFLDAVEDPDACAAVEADAAPLAS